MKKNDIEYIKCFICMEDILCTWLDINMQEEHEDIKEGVIGWKCICNNFHNVCNNCYWVQCLKCNKFVCNNELFYIHNCDNINFFPYKKCNKNWLKIINPN